MAVKPIPAGFHTVTPYLSVENAPKIIEFMKKAFDAQQLLFHDLGGGHVHAEVPATSGHGAAKSSRLGNRDIARYLSKP